MLRLVTNLLNVSLLWIGWFVASLFWLLTKGAPRAWKFMRGQKKAPTHGAAGFATLKELEKTRHLEPGGFLYGVMQKKRVFALSESCVHFFAKRGEGKSATMSANLRYMAELTKQPDFVVNDPAMELFNWNWPFLKEKGYALLLLNLDDPDASISQIPEQTFYNSLSFLNNSTTFSYGRDVESIASLLVSEADEGKDSRHFIDAAHGVVVALIDWEYQNRGKDATLAEPLRLLTTASEEERDRVFDRIKNTGSEVAKAGINVFLRVKEREKGSFNSTIGRKLRVYNDKALREIMKPRGNPWTWEDVFLLDKPVAVFIVGGLGGEGVAGAFARLVIGQCIDSVKRFNNQHRKKLLKPLRIMIDETDTLGHCRPLVHAVTQLRKADVNIFAAWQSRGQIFSNYGGREKAEPFISGCDLMITGGITDLAILKDFAELLGDYTAHAKSESKAQHGVSEGTHEAPRKLMNIQELRSLERGSSIVLADRLNVKVELPFKIENGIARYL